MLDWEWYEDTNTFRLFMHCILKANFKEKEWRGMSIPRGSFWTSLNALSDETGLSVKQIRNSINRLERTGELASKGQATGSTRGRMVTVVQYDAYQEEGKQNEFERADKGQAKGKQGADKGQLHKNDKKEKNEKKERIEIDFSPLGMSDEQVSEVKRIRRKNGGGALTQRVVNALAKEIHNACSLGYTFDELLTEWEFRAWKSFKAEWIKPKANQGYSTITQGNIDMLNNLELN